MMTTSREEEDESHGAWFCTLIGLTPPCVHHWKSASSHISTIPGMNSPLRWTLSYSMARNIDEEGSPWTLICTVHCREPATPNHVLDALQSWFRQRETEGVQESVTCEIWASAPAPLPLRPFQEDEDKDNSVHHAYDCLVLGNEEEEADAHLSKRVELLHQWGIMIQPRLLTSTQVMELVPLAMEAIQVIEDAITAHHPTIRMGYDSFAFTEIASRTQQRFDVRIDPESNLGRRLYEMVVMESSTSTKEYIQAMFPTCLWDNEDLSIEYDLIYSKPGATHQGWHADGHHLPGREDAGWGDEKQSLEQLAPLHALCLFIPLRNLDSSVGYTQFWPGSHRHRALVGFGPVAPLVHATYDGMVNAGDAIWYDYRLLHRGMPNVSRKEEGEGAVRCIVQVIVKQKAYADPVNFGTRSIFSNYE